MNIFRNFDFPDFETPGKIKFFCIYLWRCSSKIFSRKFPPPLYEKWNGPLCIFFNQREIQKKKKNSNKSKELLIAFAFASNLASNIVFFYKTVQKKMLILMSIARTENIYIYIVNLYS